MEESSGRRCGRCHAVKPLGEFDVRKKGGWQGYCRLCHCTYKKEYYLQNKEKYVTRVLKHRAKLRATVRAAKDRPCADCGRQYPHYVMDFDHREGEQKCCNVSALNDHHWISLNALLAEIAKCDVVCANCHRERTHQRRLRKKAGAKVSG